MRHKLEKHFYSEYFILELTYYLIALNIYYLL